MGLIMSVKNFVASVKLKRRKETMPTEQFEFPSVLTKPKHVLVCLPNSLRQLTVVKQFLPTLSDLFRPAEITLLSMPGIKIADIFPRKGFRILTPTSDQMTWSGLAKKSYIKLLQDNKFDLVLDLNLENSHFISSILLGFPHAVRIGRGNHLGRPYYNLEIKTKYLRDERNIYRSMLETIRLLKSDRSGKTTTSEQHP